MRFDVIFRGSSVLPLSQNEIFRLSTIYSTTNFRNLGDYCKGHIMGSQTSNASKEESVRQQVEEDDEPDDWYVSPRSA